VLALGPNQLGGGGGGVKAWVLHRGASLEARKHTPRIEEDSPQDTCDRILELAKYPSW